MNVVGNEHAISPSTICIRASRSEIEEGVYTLTHNGNKMVNICIGLFALSAFLSTYAHHRRESTLYRPWKKIYKQPKVFLSNRRSEGHAFKSEYKKRRVYTAKARAEALQRYEHQNSRCRVFPASYASMFL
jgi:hypothetical protein